MPSPAHWRATPPPDYRGPRIGLVHGLAAGRHMEKHLLKFLREAGHADTTLYSNYHRPQLIAQDLQEAAAAGRAIALVGYSQGGFQVVKAAQELARRGIELPLLVTLAAGGAGRLYFPQLGFNPRRIPGNVKQHLNYFAEGDWLGTDPVIRHNHADALGATTQVENILIPRAPGVDHVGIARCYPPERVAPVVHQLLLERLLAELGRLSLR